MNAVVSDDVNVVVSDDVDAVVSDDVNAVVSCLVVLRLNVPVNNFSVMSGRSHCFLGN